MWIISGVVNGVLKVIFCIVFGSLIHESAGDLLSDSLTIGVGVQLVAAFVTCLITASSSSVGISISGPDIIQALMLANMAKVIGKKTDNPDSALATILFLSSLSTLLISLTWLIIVRYRPMKILDFFPVSVVTGFLGCIGYKVVEEAIHIAVGKYWYSPESLDFWRLFLPILPIGLPLFLLKRFHIGSPIIFFPFFVVTPIILFFSIVYGKNMSLDDMRYKGWMMEWMDNGVFYQQWTKLDFSLIHAGAVIACIPDLAILVLVITLDAFLQLSSTKSELAAVDMDIEKELKIAGVQSIISSLCIGTAGYSHIKFNVLNFAITNDMSERRPCIFVGLLCGVVWIGGFPLTNYLPRFFLGGLLLYAGLPFCDMVISAWWRVTKKEFFAIIIIVLVNAIAEVYVSFNLVIAVIVGLVLAAIIFMVQYSRVSVIRDLISGKDFTSAVVRSYAEQRLVERLGVRYVILELQGFIFFGTGRQVLDWTKTQEKENLAVESCRRLRYIAIDFTHVENMDYSCAKAFLDIAININGMGCQLLFTGMNDKVSSKLNEGVLNRPGVIVFDDLDHCSEYVEESLLERASFIRLHWLFFDSFRKLHTKALLMAEYEIFEAVLGSEIGGRIWRYAERREFRAGEYLCREGSINHTLFLLQRGKVTSISKQVDGTEKRLHTMRRGAFFNEECLFLDRPVSYSSIADEDSVVWAIDRKNMKDLEAHEPFLAAEILRNILRVSFAARMRLEREVSALETSTLHGNNKDVSKGLGHRILAQVTAAIPNKLNLQDVPSVGKSVSAYNINDASVNKRHHHFQHISVDTYADTGVPSVEVTNCCGEAEPKANLLEIRPHLSRPMQNNVLDCFLFHSASAEERKRGKQDYTKSSGYFASSHDLFSDLDDQRDSNYTVNLDGCPIFAKAGERRIKIKELQKAVMDLGFFPTEDEVQRMHDTLGPSVMMQITDKDHELGADIHEFTTMIEVLSFAELSRKQLKVLLNLFNEHCDANSHLSKTGLSSLMRALGHPEDVLELQMLMYEWDVHQRGYLDFSAFISIVAHVMKTEELDDKVEHDFLRVCGKHLSEIKNNRENLLRSINSIVTAKDLIRVGREQGMPINPEIAEEMIFDASESGDNAVTLDELISTIETVYRNESIQSKKPEVLTLKRRKSNRELIPGFMFLKSVLEQTK